MTELTPETARAEQKPCFMTSMNGVFGVTGDAPDNDKAAAIAGVTKAGLVAEPYCMCDIAQINGWLCAPCAFMQGETGIYTGHTKIYRLPG